MRVAVIGAGSWGTAFAGMLARSGHEVFLWARRSELVEEINTQRTNTQYLSDYTIPRTVEAKSNISELVAGVSALILATPSVALKESCQKLAPYLPREVPFCVLTKGIDAQEGLTMSELAAEVLGGPERMAALSGPNHAEEIARGLPAAAVVASYQPQIAQFFQNLVSCEHFRVYTSEDLLGVELCAASKNVIALAAGIAAGYKLGDNCLALIMTRGLAEMSRLVHAMGASAQTCMGLAGMGDLIATCTSENSRNRSFGLSFAQGESLEEFQSRRHMVVEGARACVAIKKLAEELQVDMPITRAVHALLYEGASFEEQMNLLFARMQTEEFYGLEA